MPERNREYLRTYITKISALIEMRPIGRNIVVESIKELSIFNGESRHILLLQGIDGTLFYIPVPRPVTQLTADELEQIEQTYYIATRTEPGSKVHFWDATVIIQEV